MKKIGETESGMERELSYKNLNEFPGNTKGTALEKEKNNIIALRQAS